MLNRKSLLLVFVLLLLPFLSIPPENADAINAKQKLSKIRKEIESKKEKIKESIKKEKTVRERLHDINSSIKKQKRELKGYEKQIARTRTKMSSLMKEISGMHDELGDRQDLMKERLRALYKQQYGGHALVLISATDYQDLIRKSRYISLLAHYDKSVISQYTEDIQELLDKKTKLESLNDELISSKALAERAKKSLETDRKKKDRLLSMIKSKRETYERSVKELENSSRKVQQMIMKMKKKKLPVSITGKGFRASKGRLPWPVSGKVAIPYGEYNDPKYNIRVFKNGIEISPAKGQKPKAIAGGRVVYADWFKGYGLLLIIDHGGGYHSLYGNLSEIFLKTGDILIEGTVVGKIGKSQLLNYPTLYFEVRYKGKPVNPKSWLTRKGYRGKKVRIK